MDGEKLAVRDRKRNCSRVTPASAQWCVELRRIELNPEVLGQYYLCDYRLGLRSLAGSGLNCCRVAGEDCG